MGEFNCMYNSDLSQTDSVAIVTYLDYVSDNQLESACKAPLAEPRLGRAVARGVLGGAEHPQVHLAEPVLKRELSTLC